MGKSSIDLSQFTQEELQKILAVAALFESKGGTPAVEEPKPEPEPAEVTEST